MNGVALGCGAIQYPGFVTGGSKDRLLLTNDGGETWVESQLPVDLYSNKPGGMTAEWIGKKLIAGEKVGKLFVYQGDYFNFPIGGTIPKLPANLEQKTSLTPQLKWTYAPGATKYKLQVATDETFSNMIVNRDDIDGNKFNLSGLETNTKYYWRVQACNSKEEAEWSETFEFTTGTGNSVAEYIGEFKIYPNPANEKITIELPEYTVSKKQTGNFEVSKVHYGLQEAAELIIYDMFGRKVKSLHLLKTQTQTEIDVSLWKSGIYMIELRSGGKVLDKGKFVVN